MFRLNPVIRNFFIRVEAVISVVFKRIVSFFAFIFDLFTKAFGFSQSGYFLDSNQAQTVKRVQTQELPKTDSVKNTEVSTTFRRPKIKIEDYYVKMAKDVKKG